LEGCDSHVLEEERGEEEVAFVRVGIEDLAGVDQTRSGRGGGEAVIEGDARASDGRIAEGVPEERDVRALVHRDLASDVLDERALKIDLTPSGNLARRSHPSEHVVGKALTGHAASVELGLEILEVEREV